MLPRVYVPSLDPRSRTAELPADEAGHLRRVLRIRPGAAILIFDGRGHEFAARVAAVDRSAVVAEIGAPVEPAREWAVRVTLAQALLKGDKTDAVIRDAVMMGVADIQLLLTARTDIPASALTRGRRIERWQRIAAASAKQCGRAIVPTVHPPLTLPAYVGSSSAETRLMLVEPAAGRSGQILWQPAAAPGSALVLVGPEGGWADEEVAFALSAGVLPMSLGPRTLRADAAPIIALSVLQCAWGEIPGLNSRDSEPASRQ